MDASDHLPPQGHLVIRGGTLLTQDPELGELDEADVEMLDGAIVAVGRVTGDHPVGVIRAET